MDFQWFSQLFIVLIDFRVQKSWIFSILLASLNSYNFFVRHPFRMPKVALESPDPNSFISGLTFEKLIQSSELHPLEVVRVYKKSTVTAPLLIQTKFPRFSQNRFCCGL